MLITQEHFDRIYAENQIPMTCLVVIINDDCNANCKACIARQTFKSPLCQQLCEKYQECKSLRCCAHATDDETFYERLDHILDTINSSVVSIIITGGEPTLSPRLLPTLEIIDKHNYAYKELQLETNGANLKDPIIAKALKDRNVQIQLSRYAMTSEENAAEFRYNSNPVTEEDIQEFATTFGEQLGISTVLLRKYVEDGEKLLALVDHYRDMGINRHTFLEFQADTTLEEQNPEVMEYYDQERISILDLASQLQILGVEKIEETVTEAFIVSRFMYKGYEIRLTGSDLSRQRTEEQHNEFSRFLIMPSGEIGVNGVEKR